MSLDTKYRPLSYGDVLGQVSAIKILRRFASTGAGFQQSYLFAGPWGGGKTTLGRILARSLLCENLTETGDACNKCMTCRSLIESGSSLDFVEIDAATNSGKADIKKITEEIQYMTFSGRHRIYLFDECFTENTRIFTEEGVKTIKEIVDSCYKGKVVSINDEGSIVWTPVENWFYNGEKEVVELVFDNGVHLEVTENQEIFTSNRGWVFAKDLTCNDNVVDWHQDSNKG